MSVESSKLCFSDMAVISSHYALAAFTYGATAFTWIQTAGQFVVFPLITAIGLIAGIAIRWVGEIIFKDLLGLCCPCCIQARFDHRLVGAITSVAAGVICPLRTIDPFSLGLCSGWMLGNSYKEAFFTSANLETGASSFFRL